MATYLLTWSPRRWHWWDEISDVFHHRNGGYLGKWSSGNTKRIVPGDRVFLIRLGKEPRGIVGAGHALSRVYEGNHWDKRRARRGDIALLVRIRLDVLRNPGREAVYPLANLKRGVLRSMNWEPPSSGLEIPAPLARHLEREWSKFVGKGVAPVSTAAASALEGLLTETVAYSRGRSRMLRELALARSRGVCEACLVDFSKLLDGKGVRALQAHHRKQLAISDKPRLTKLHEIAVICATCHALIHAHPKEGDAGRASAAIASTACGQPSFAMNPRWTRCAQQPHPRHRRLQSWTSRSREKARNQPRMSQCASAI